MATLLWNELSSGELADLGDRGTVAVLPIGSVEQHGPHLPLGTDTMIAESVAHAALAGPVPPAVALPTISVALSSEHTWAKGTLSLPPGQLLSLLDSIGSAVARAGLKRLVFLNGHGGNSAALRVAARELRLSHGLLTFVAHPHTPADQGGTSSEGLEIHAGFRETSVMLHLRPDLVRMELAERCVPEWLDRYRLVGFGKPVSFGWTSDDFGKSGVIGDPGGANAEAGRAAFSEAVTAFQSALAEIAAFDL